MYLPSELKYREQTDSGKMTNEFLQIYESLKDSSLNMADMQNKIETMDSIISSDRAGLENRLAKLSSLIENQSLGTTYISLYDAEKVIYPDGLDELEKCTYEQAYGRAILNVIKSDRLYITTDVITGERSLVSDINSLVFRKSNTNKGSGARIDQLIETNVTDALDPDPRKIYLARFLTYDPGINAVDLEVELNTRNSVDKPINTVRIDPVPEGMLTLDHMVFSNSAVDKRYFRNSGYGVEYGAVINEMRRTAWSIDLTNINKFNFQLRQINKEGSQPYNFIIGIRNIVLENNLYAARSYVGLHIIVPPNKSKLINVQHNLDELGDVALIKIYNNINDFNLRNDNFIYQSGAVISYRTAIDVVEREPLYILVELNKFPGDKEITPELENVVLTWR